MPKPITGEITTEDKHRRAFGRIFEFVIQLDEAFGSKTKQNTPIGKYRRLIQAITISDDKAIIRVTTGFKTFFDLYGSYFIENKLEDLPNDATITYRGAAVNYDLPIQKYIRQSDEGTRSVIRQYILVIANQMGLGGENSNKLSEALRMAMNSDFTSGSGEPVNEDELTAEEKEFIETFMKKFKNIFAGQQHNMTSSSILKLVMEEGLLDEMDAWMSGRDNIDPVKIVRALQQYLVKGIVKM